MNKFENFLYKRFIGFNNNRDEYQEKEINKKLALGYIFAFYMILVLMMISFIIDTVNHTISFGTVALFLLLEFISLYIFIGIRKNKIDTTECYSQEEYRLAIKKLKKNSLFIGIFWGVSIFLFTEMLSPFLTGENFNIKFFSIIIYSIGGFIFGTIMYFLEKSKLKKEF
ncbi:MAG: DUF3278 domain-containing protein [Miniphocaeibacter sp.]|uniref:DUF3278 domain-containing protein n=1 Tax=Miniphocaeibacter sp. TaxID=3100973 RepID=UPI00180AC573|nr:DUF3278 domain-containing protein [Gallicola sp.]